MPSVLVTDRDLALMSAIRTQFPSSKNILCIWHINKDVQANCKKYFPVQDDFTSFISKWCSVIESQTENEFEVQWNQLINTFEPTVSYLQKQWIPYKEMFIKAWTNKYLHLGNTATSRGEGAHATLKSYLQVSTGKSWQYDST